MARRLLMCVALAVALMACSPRTASADAELSPKAFRDLYIARVEAALPGTRFKRLDDETIEITLPGKEAARASTRMAYVEYLRSPDRLDDVIDRVIATLTQDEAELKPKPERLVVILRTKDTDVTLGTLRPRKLIHRPFEGDLVQFLAIDSPAAIQYADEETLRTLGMNEDQAWARGLANLPERIGRLDVEPMEEIDQLTGTVSESGLATSALLLPEACVPGGNGKLTLMLARHFFVQPTTEDAGTIAGFWRLAKFEATNPDAYSRTVIACRDGRWAAVEPPTG